MIPADGSYLLFDVGIMNHATGQELRIDGVSRTGGSMLALNMAPENSDASLQVSFEPRALHVDEQAVPLVRRLFPEIASTLEAAGEPLEEATVVEGRLRISSRRGDLRHEWQPLSTCGGDARPGTVAELLARKWEDTNVVFHHHAGTDGVGGAHEQENGTGCHAPGAAFTRGGVDPGAAQGSPVFGSSSGATGQAARQIDPAQAGGWKTSRTFAARNKPGPDSSS